MSTPSSCPQLVHRTELPTPWFPMGSRLRVRAVVSLTVVQRMKSTARSLQWGDKPLNLVPSPICSLHWPQQPARGDWRQKFCLGLFPPCSLWQDRGKRWALIQSPSPPSRGEAALPEQLERGHPITAKIPNSNQKPLSLCS